MVSAVRFCPQAGVMFNFSKLLNWQYLSNPYPPTELAHKITFLIIAGSSILVTILMWLIFSRIEKKFQIYENIKFRLFYFFLFFGIISVILIFFRIEGVPFFSSRLFVLIFLFGFLIWLILILFYLWQKFPKELAKYQDKIRKERYLPQPKRK